MHTDGGFNSEDVDVRLNDENIEQYQTAIRGKKGKKSDEDRLSVSDFVFTRNEKGEPQTVRCPYKQQVEVRPAQKEDRFTALFDQATCQTCPLLPKCPTERLRRKPKRVLRFNQKQVYVARRCENQRKAKASGRNLRSAVEATVRSVKHPFGNGKLPVRGKRRVSMMIIASAAMTNVRRIWRYKTAENGAENSKITEKQEPKQADSTCFSRWRRSFVRFQKTQRLYQPLAA